MRLSFALLMLLLLGSQPVAGASAVRATGTPDADALAAHAAAGGSLVVDLRTPPEGLGEVAFEAARLGLDYVNLPVGNEAASDQVLARFTELVAGADGEVLVHCASGNRAGEVLARWLLEQGAAREEALARGREAGLQPAREGFVGEPRAEP